MLWAATNPGPHANTSQPVTADTLASFWHEKSIPLEGGREIEKERDRVTETERDTERETDRQRQTETER